MRVPEHQHDFGEMIWITQGTGRHILNGEVRTFQPNQLWWIEPEDRHALEAPRGSKLQYINLAFPAPLWEGAQALGLPLIGPLRGFDVAEDATAKLLDFTFRSALKTYLTGASEVDAAGTLLELVRQAGSLAARPSSHEAAPAWLRTALRVMERDHNMRAGVERLVSLCHRSPEHVARTCRATLGRTPTELVTDLRLKTARYLLGATDTAISSIAFQCGFASVEYFYRVFTSEHGMPPKAYRLATRAPLTP
jgi:AraC-like DNA-binding protein